MNQRFVAAFVMPGFVRVKRQRHRFAFGPEVPCIAIHNPVNLIIGVRHTRMDNAVGGVHWLDPNFAHIPAAMPGRINLLTIHPQGFFYRQVQFFRG